jgi:hypothetical protein
MKTIPILISFLLLPILVSAQNYQVGQSVIASGGGQSQSANYSAEGTIGQPIIGHSTSENFIVDGGFWAGIIAGGPQCNYIVGDINNSGNLNGVDVTYGVSYFKGGPAPPYSCECVPGNTWFVAGDVNASCNFNGVDITYLVSYFKGGSAPRPCPECLPGNLPLGKQPHLTPIAKKAIPDNRK